MEDVKDMQDTTHQDRIFCERICRIARDLGYTLDEMDTRVGWSFAFVAVDGARVSGGICGDRQSGLLSACKKLLPAIYQHL